ncbi:MAG: hypothetical protein AB7N54_15770 [Alphaproteobacteria bacterium]
MVFQTALLLVTAIVFGALAIHTIAVGPRDTWDAAPGEAPPRWNRHKATLGIPQPLPPDAEPWERDLAALGLEHKHRLC